VAFPFWKLIGESLRRGKQKLFRADAKGRGEMNLCVVLYTYVCSAFFSIRRDDEEEEEAAGREEKKKGGGNLFHPLVVVVVVNLLRAPLAPSYKQQVN
jgi:hypothetical protein